MCYSDRNNADIIFYHRSDDLKHLYYHPAPMNMLASVTMRPVHKVANKKAGCRVRFFPVLIFRFVWG